MTATGRVWARLAGAACGVIASTAFAVPAGAVPPPPAPTQLSNIVAVDTTGRYVLVRMSFPFSPQEEQRIDRLTWETVATPKTFVVSADLRWAITAGDASGTNRRWRHLDTGIETPVPFDGQSTPRALSGDGQHLLLTKSDAGGAVVATRSGALDVAPLASATAIDMSPNARWVLARTPCVPDRGIGCNVYHRWDRVDRRVTLVSSGEVRLAHHIGDDGSVIESEWLAGNGFTGGIVQINRRDLDGSAVALTAPNEPLTDMRVSDDGSLLAFRDALQRVVMIDSATGQRSTYPGVVVPFTVVVGGTGAVIMAAQPGVAAPTTADLVAITPPGRQPPPRLVAGEEHAVPVTGLRAVPADATSVVLNVTVTNPAGPGFATVWPCDEPRPLASNVNFTAAGTTVANAVVAKVASTGPSAGAVCLAPSTAIDVIVDVQGYFTGDAYAGIAPDRFLDTRNGETDLVPNKAAGEEFAVRVAGVRGVPADATSAALNVTVANSAGPGFVSVWPCDEQRPLASNVNVTRAGQTVANAVVAKIATAGASAGSVCVSGSTAVDVIVDVQGYVTGDAYSGIAPDRFLDTRNGDTDAVPNVAGGAEVPLTIAGVRGVPADAGAVVVNVTVTNPTGPGFVTVWPCDEQRPLASNVNVGAAVVTVANAVVAKVAAEGASAGSICLYASTAVDLIVDVQGWFTGAAYTGVTPDRFLDTRD